MPGRAVAFDVKPSVTTAQTISSAAKSISMMQLYGMIRSAVSH
ncbi:hypothetical protein [Burkholderia cenocepacia]|nr:hypothetical protein [Burkholderia cenocepacia]